MNVYDFDKTIYDGDSTIDFYFYCLRTNPTIIKYIPKQILGFILYFLKRIKRTQMKEYFYSFLNGIKDIDKKVELFWEKNDFKIQQWYLNQKEKTDIIISASPEFLLLPIRKELEIQELIASKVNKLNGIYEGENCRGEEKVRRFKIDFEDTSIDEFYSDSLSDSPMANLAKKAFLIENKKIKSWPK